MKPFVRTWLACALGLVAIGSFGGLACGTSERRGFEVEPTDPVVDASVDAVDETNFGTDGGKYTRDPQTCEEALANKSYVGCDFWPTVTGNGVWDLFDFAVVVANVGPAAATVTVTRTPPADTADAGADGASEAGADAGAATTPFSTTETVPPGELRKIYLPWVKDLKGPESNVQGQITAMTQSVLSRGGAYHLVSSVPVIVYQFSPLEYRPKGGPSGKDWSDCPGNRDGGVGCLSFSNDASLLLPTPALTGTYRITGQKGLTLFSQGIGFPVAGPYFAVTATADDTHVTVNLSPTARVMASPKNEIPFTNGGGTMSLTLNAGDVAEVIGATGDTSDFSGSLVVADKPVQVISGAPCQQQPPDKAACDHIEESVFPAETLGQHYVVMVPTAPKGAVVGHIVRMYGNIDDTKLTYIPASAKPSGCPTRLQAGQIVDCGIVDHDFEVKGDHEFAVGSFMLAGELLDKQGALGDPSQSLVVPVDQFRTQYAFLAPDDYAANYVDVVAPTGTDVVIDGKPPVRPFAPLAGTTFSLARVPLSAGKSGAHTLTANAQVGIQVIGYGSSTSYYYPGGLNLGQLAAPPPH